MRLADCGKVRTQPLCTRLTDTQRGTDSPDRGNTVGCQISREHHRGALSERIGPRRIVMRSGRGRRRLRAADDHYQQLVGAGERDRRPRGHGGADQAMA
jgi:hypothetical protein